jgi:hypothetical protein
MNQATKPILIGMAAGALGLTMVGCGDDAEATEGTEEVSSGGESHCGEGAEHQEGEASCGAADPAADTGGEAGTEEGGEASCGE